MGKNGLQKERCSVEGVEMIAVVLGARAFWTFSARFLGMCHLV